MAVNGNTLIIMRGGNVIAGTKSNEIECGCETIEISSATAGQWRKYIAGRKEWSVSVNYLVPETESVEDDILTVGQTYTLNVYDRLGWLILSGQAICTSCRITATKGNLIQGSFSFKGTGALN